MRIAACWIAVIALFWSFGSRPCMADDEETLDNNGKLARTMSLQCETKRLHVIADMLSQATGLEIRCGTTPDDWQVRDIPVFVCAKDLPLKDLLRAIAGAAHVSIHGRQMEDGKIIYRFSRDRRSQQQIDDWAEINKKANRAVAAWAWDALASYANSPMKPSDIPTKDPQSSRSEETETALASSLLASLGPNVRDRLMAGEQISVDMSNPNNADALKNLFVYCSRHTIQYGSAVEPTEQEIAAASMRIRLNPSDMMSADPDSVGLQCMVDGIPYEEDSNNDGNTERHKESWGFDPVDYASDLAKDPSLGIPKRPDLLPRDYPPTSDARPLRTTDDWSNPALETRVKLDGLKEKKNPRIDDLLTALANASGFSIVCEDFRSHKLPTFSRVEGDFSEEMSIEDVLTALNTGIGRVYGFQWYVDAPKKLLIGCDMNWHDRHLGLMPEATLNAISEKMDGDGADLEDILPIFRATKRQFTDWIFQTEEFRNRISMSTDDWTLWTFFASLSQKDRTTAEDTGLALAAEDTGSIARYFAGRLAEANKTNSWDNPQAASELDALTRPDVISTFTVHVVTVPADKSATSKKHTYRLELEGLKDGDKLRLVAKLNQELSFPLYSLKREADIQKQQDDAKSGDSAKS